MTSDATALDARLAQIEADMAKSDPRFVSPEVREIVQCGRAILASLDGGERPEPVGYVVIGSDGEERWLVNMVDGYRVSTGSNGLYALGFAEEVVRVQSKAHPEYTYTVEPVGRTPVSEGERVEKDDEGRPYPCGAFVSNDSRWFCRLESDHDGEHEWVQNVAWTDPHGPMVVEGLRATESREGEEPR